MSALLLRRTLAWGLVLAAFAATPPRPAAADEPHWVTPTEADTERAQALSRGKSLSVTLGALSDHHAFVFGGLVKGIATEIDARLGLAWDSEKMNKRGGLGLQVGYLGPTGLAVIGLDLSRDLGIAVSDDFWILLPFFDVKLYTSFGDDVLLTMGSGLSGLRFTHAPPFPFELSLRAPTARVWFPFKVAGESLGKGRSDITFSTGVSLDAAVVF